MICTLKHSDNTISRRQEVGRGLRLSVNQNGDRMDDPATVHQINVLTVVASESYKDFVAGSAEGHQRVALRAAPARRTRHTSRDKVLKTADGRCDGDAADGEADLTRYSSRTTTRTTNDEDHDGISRRKAGRNARPPARRSSRRTQGADLPAHRYSLQRRPDCPRSRTTARSR